jgi:hypothetical protein
MEKKMGCGYAHLINNFQAFTTDVTENKVNTDNIDMLLTTLTDIYVSILENGTVSVEVENIQFRSRHTKEFFITGLSGLKQTKTPEAIELILEFLLLQTTRDQTVSMPDLFEVYLLTKIIPILRPEGGCIKKYITFLIEFCSGKIRHYQIAKFVKFIDAYKLTDYYVLNTIRALVHSQ